MLKFVTKSIIKYLVILVVTFITSIILFLFMHILLDKQMEKHNKQYASIMTNLKMINEISNYIVGIKALIFEITAATQTLEHRNILNNYIEQDIVSITILAKSLGIDFVTPDEFFNELAQLEKTNTVLINILKERDIALKNIDSKLPLIAKKVRAYNYTVPFKINNLLQYVKKSKTLLNKKQQKYKAVIKKEAKKYFYIEVFISCVIVLITLYLSKLISQHIVRLYEKLETQLYIDELTKLHNRFALNKTYKDVKKPFVIILNIDLFRVINELYGTDIGNEVLKKLAIMMREYFFDTKFELFRIAGDEFVLFEENVNYTTKEIEKIIFDFLHYVKEHKIYIENISHSIEVDFTCGVSTCKDNFLGKADIALNYAKRNSLPFAIYKTEIDNKIELKENLFWKTKIQEGIQEDLFLPFFQPIFDRNGVIQNYESLMRLKQEDRKGISFISPYKFLTIAKKTKNYHKISSMTMFKSLDICKEKGFQISINVDKSDMLNTVLRKELKEKIIKLGKGQEIIFEMLESENIIDNEEIKSFILEFKALGAKFAIDDFGSGYSNFSFILDIKPDFIKIDGSLIKNITKDNNSYELVKSIVAFAKALNILTIAEFVHSKEVYDTVLDLGVDRFQGYYLGEPKEICL